MSMLAAPATRPTNDVALEVKGWAKPMPAQGGVAGEAGVQARLDAGPVTVQDRVVGYGAFTADKIHGRAEKSIAVAAGDQFEVAGRVRTSVIGIADKVTVESRTSGSIDAGPVNADAAVEGRVSVGANGLRAGGNANASVAAGQVAASAKGAASAGIGAKGFNAKANASGTANVGSAAIGGSLSGAASITRSGAKLSANATADARLGGRTISLAASGSVRFDGEFPFIHVDGSVSLRTSKDA